MKMLKRNNQIHVYLDDRELQRFKRKVSKSGLTQNAYVRHLMNDRIPQDKPPPDYFSILKEIRAIGRNINQLTMLAHATGVIDEERFDRKYRLLLDALLKLIDTAE
jgi:hypothetical protein